MIREDVLALIRLLTGDLDGLLRRGSVVRLTFHGEPCVGVLVEEPRGCRQVLVAVDPSSREHETEIPSLVVSVPLALLQPHDEDREETLLLIMQALRWTADLGSDPRFKRRIVFEEVEQRAELLSLGLSEIMFEVRPGAGLAALSEWTIKALTEAVTWARVMQTERATA